MRSIAQSKSEDFAVRIINLKKYLANIKRERTISDQILRSGTSIGANLSEAEFAVSRSDYLSKVYIALKEANETLYWLRLLYKTGYITESQYLSVYSDCDEIKKMLSATTKTIRTNQTVSTELPS